MNELAYQLRYALPIWLVGFVTDWWPDNRVTIRVRGWLYSRFIPRCGRDLVVQRRVTLLNVHNLTIGDGVGIATGTWIDAMGGVTLEDGVRISPYVVLASSTHCFRDGRVLAGESRQGPIRVRTGTWLASHVVVSAGTTVGAGCLVAGNAAVTKDTPDHVMLGGVPAKVLGPVPELPGNLRGRFKPVEPEAGQ